MFHRDPCRRVIDYFLDELPRVCMIKVPRYNMGAGGHITMPTSGGVVANYKDMEYHPSSFKAVARGNRIADKRFSSARSFPLKRTSCVVLNKNYTVAMDHHNALGLTSEVPLYIRHYYTKSFEEFVERCRIRKPTLKTFNHGCRKDCSFKKFAASDVSRWENKTLASPGLPRKGSFPLLESKGATQIEPYNLFRLRTF